MDIPADVTSQPTRQLVGMRINNYEVKSLLGEGGMGAVYIAQHPVIDRKVAVKVLKREFAENQALVHRFFNEARAANAIRHPNIIEVLDVGTLADGLPYLIMPLLEGESLAARIGRSGRLSVGDAVELASQAASALAAAHGKGIVHRDLKPDNIFLVADLETPGRERVKILDFGIAKLSQELSGTGARTGTGAVMGTPPYMSPEQCRGITSEIDQRTDIYALGIILYEILCGAPPFVSQGFGEILMMHMSREPAPPTSINPEIPPHLERVILKALAKKREDRFGSMSELQAALRDKAQVSEPAAGTRRDGAGMVAQPARTQLLPPSAAAPGTARQITTFSSSTGAMESVGGEDAAAPARFSRRWLALGAGGAVAAAVFVLAGHRKPPPPSGRQSAAAAPNAPAAAAAPRTEPSPPPPIPPPAPEPVQPAATVAPPRPAAPVVEEHPPEPAAPASHKTGARGSSAAKRTAPRATRETTLKTEPEAPPNRAAAPAVPSPATPPAKDAPKRPLVF